MPWLLRDNDQARVFEELDAESDRAAAIIGGSLVEMHLTAALETHLRPDGEIFHELFRPGGPIGDFADKIRLGFMIGLFDRPAYRDLVIIKELRNDFAHKLTYRDFTDQSVRDRVGNLSLVEHYPGRSHGEVTGNGQTDICGTEPESGRILYEAVPAEPRARFLLSCQLLSFLLSDIADHRFIERVREPMF